MPTREQISTIPPILPIDPRSQLTLKLHQYQGISDSQIKSFNWYLTWYVDLINSSVILLDDGSEITFRDAQITRPMVRVETASGFNPTLPNQCRLLNKDYMGEVQAVAEYQGKTKPITLDPIPIELGSRACHLSTMNDAQLRSVGECPQDPLGYFIIRGTEKTIIMQERAARNRIITYLGSDDEPLTELSCVASDDRRVPVKVALMKKEDHEPADGKRSKIAQKVVKVMLPSFGDAEINVCAVFEILAPDTFSDVEQIQAYVLDWVDEEYRSTVASYLDQTLESYYNVRGNAVGYIAAKLSLASKKIRRSDIKAEVERIVEAELFVNMLEDSRQKRAELLALLVARFISVVTGVRAKRLDPIGTAHIHDTQELMRLGLDDRDDYSNKSIATSGSLCAFLTSQAWGKQLTDTAMYLNGLLNQKDMLQELSTYMSNPSHMIVGKSLARSIGSGNWGLANRTQHAGITRTLQQESLAGRIEDLRTVDAPMSHKSSDAKPRSVHLTYWGFICPTSTKEDDSCGLAKALTQGATTSLPRDHLPLIDLFEGDISPERLLFSSEAGNDRVLLPEEEQRITPLIFGGRFLGWVNQEDFRTKFILMRRGELHPDENPDLIDTLGHGIPYDVSISVDIDGILQVLNNEGRPIRPVLVVNFRTQRLAIDEKHMWNASWADLMARGCIDYLDPAEQSCSLIAINPSDLNVKDPATNRIPLYTHVELDPALIQSYGTNLVPFPGYNPGPRITYGRNMATHSVGLALTTIRGTPANAIEPVRHGRFENARVGVYLTKPIIYTDAYQLHQEESVMRDPKVVDRLAKLEVSKEELNVIKKRLQEASSTNLMGVTGVNAVVAIASGIPESFHEDDAIIMNRRFVDLGGFMMTTFKNDHYEIENPSVEKMGVMPGLPEAKLPLYSAIDPNTGFARPGSVLRPGMVIVAKYTEIGGVRRDTSISLREMDSITPAQPLTAKSVRFPGRQPRSVLSTNISNEPIMDDFLIGRSNGRTILKWRTRITRRPQTGDKFASRFSQKGVIGAVIDPEDMPFAQDGISPDIIMNPHGIPSRMTVGHIIESLTGKAGALLGERLNATPFRDLSMESANAVLQLFNYHPMGLDVFYDGATGQQLECMVYQGLVYYTLQRQVVEEKKNARGQGSFDHLYRQPPGGKSRGGGLRQGEMERDVYAAHGAPAWLLERYKIVSDPEKMSICSGCGLPAIANPRDNYSICNVCSEMNPINTVIAPTSLRLLTTYNAGMGVKIQMNIGHK